MKHKNGNVITSNNHQCPKCKSYFTETLPHILEQTLMLIFIIPFFVNVLALVIPHISIIFKQYIGFTFVLLIIGIILFEVIKIKNRKIYCKSCNNIFIIDESNTN